jgi:hypothetical protein
MLRDALILYGIGILTIVIIGAISIAIIVLFDLKVNASSKAQITLIKGYSWWQILAIGLMGSIMNLAYTLSYNNLLPDKHLESLIIIAAGPLLGIITLSLSGYLILAPFNLKGLGQNLGILTGLFFGEQIRETVIHQLSHYIQ